MIEFIRGTVSDLTPTSVVLRDGRRGLFPQYVLNTSSRLKEGETASSSFESIREDAHDLFQFIDAFERELFLLLITVQGIGPLRHVLMLATTPRKTSPATSPKNTTALKGVKGVGARTAERIIVELKNKIGDIYAGISPVGGCDCRRGSARRNTRKRKRHSLALGYTPAQAKAVGNPSSSKADPDMSVNEIVRQGLRLMVELTPPSPSFGPPRKLLHALVLKFSTHNDSQRIGALFIFV